MGLKRGTSSLLIPDGYTMIKWIRTSRLSLKNSLSWGQVAGGDWAYTPSESQTHLRNPRSESPVAAVGNIIFLFGGYDYTVGTWVSTIT